MNLVASWLVPVLYTLCFGGVAYVVLKAVHAGSEAYADEYMSATSRQFEDIFLFIPPRRINQIAWGISGACFVAVFGLTADVSSVAGVATGILLGAIAGGSALCVPGLMLKVLRNRRVARFNAQLVDALSTMSNALRAGFSITQSLESVAKEGANPIAQEFSVLLQQTRIGVRLEDALESLEQRVHSEDLSLMVQSVEVARITGGNLTEVFDRIAETIRERIRIQGRITSLTAQGRLQGIVVGMMPLLLGFAVFAIDPRMMMSFLSAPAGWIALIAVVALELAGALMIRKIIRIDV